MSHDAEVTVFNALASFKNNSPDGFANGVKVSDDGHTATLYIDDTDADVSVISENDAGIIEVSIGTNGEFGSGPFLVITGTNGAPTRMTDISGIVEVISRAE